MHALGTAYTTGAYHDVWFANSAMSIAQGHWLGPFNSMTLIKGPGFIYFLVLDHFYLIPLKLALGAMYAFACAAVAWAIWRSFSVHRWAVFVLYVVPLFEPVDLPSRVYRCRRSPSNTHSRDACQPEQRRVVEEQLPTIANDTARAAWVLACWALADDKALEALRFGGADSAPVARDSGPVRLDATIDRPPDLRKRESMVRKVEIVWLGF